MRLSLLVAASLCFTTWMSVVHATHGPVSDCCPRWSNTLKRVPLKQILDYTIQPEGACSFAAVVFQTKCGLRICSDPHSDRTKEAILKVDEEKRKTLQERGQDEDGSTSNSTPTVSTKSKKTRQRKGRNGRRCQRKKSRRGRKGQRKRG